MHLLHTGAMPDFFLPMGKRASIYPGIPQEIQFDEHKLLIVYGEDHGEFEELLQNNGIQCSDQMKFITEAEHVHSSSDAYARQFEELKTRLGMDCAYV